MNKDNYDNFNIGDKEPKEIFKYHTGPIWCSTVLKDGRFVTGSADKSIIIYNNKTFKPDLIIKKHKDGVTCLIQLNSGELVSCSNDKTIKLYNIQYQLGVLKYNIDDIFNEIYRYNIKIKLIKDMNKYKLRIEFLILNKKRYINIELQDNI